jgi:stearoyl-CoA desaturase (delta-9 desaturase)
MFKRYYEFLQPPLSIILLIAISTQWSTIIAGLIFAYVVMVVSQEAGGHRYFSHYSFNTATFYERLMFASMVIAANGSPLDWRSSHLDHHSYSDTENDPTSPKKFGIIGIMSNYWKLKYHPGQTALRSMIWVSKNKPQWITYHEAYFKLVIMYQIAVLAISIILGFDLFIALVVLPVLVSNIYLNAISAFCHQAKYREGDTKNYAIDNTIINIFSPGAGNHREHHNNPGSYKSTRFDVTGIVIDLIKKEQNE